MAERDATGMACPVCRVGLVMTDRQGIEIDYCPTCRGVWLDRGELDKIIERSMSSERGGGREQRTVHRDERHGYDSGNDRHGRKHESFLSRLFD